MRKKDPPAAPSGISGVSEPSRQEPEQPIEVREMTIEDIPTVFQLGERIFRPEDAPNLYRTWDEYELIDSFSSDGEYCLVAEQGERILGFVLGTIIEKRKSAWTYGYLVWLGVDPDAARKGVARRLVARLTDLFIEAGARIMMVDTDAENDPARRFFEGLGFGQPVEHVYMTRNLTTTTAYQRWREREAAAEQRFRRKQRNGDKSDGREDDER